MFDNLKLNEYQKYQIVTKNKERFMVNEIKNMNHLQIFAKKDYHNHQSQEFDEDMINQIRLETAYRWCIPQINHFIWQEKINYEVMYPMTAIVAFHFEEYAIGYKINLWVASGGTRTTPLKANCDKDKLIHALKNSHAMVIPQCKNQSQNIFFQLLAEVLSEKQYIHYPVLALGNSGLFLMIALKNRKRQLQKQQLMIKQMLKSVVKQTKQSMIFVSHKDKPFVDLDLRHRLDLQNKFKCIIKNGISTHLFRKFKLNDIFMIIGLSKTKNEQYFISNCKLKSQQQVIWFSWVNIDSATSQIQISLNHKFIINFYDQVRRYEKKIDQKQIQTEQYKLTVRQNESYFNIDTKIPKI